MVTLPLTPSQLHIWKSQVISPDKPLFNQVVTAHLDSQYFSQNDAAKLCAAWIQVQTEHEVLTSTIISSSDASPRQHFVATAHAMEIVNLNAECVADERTLKNWISSRGAHLFELDQKMTDAVLVRWGDNQHTVFLNMHHLIVDAVSSQWVLQTLFSQFEQLRSLDGHQNTSKNSEIPTPQFADFASNYKQREITDVLSTATQTNIASQTTPGLSSGTAETQPSFYTHINDFPITDSVRLPVTLSPDENRLIDLLSASPELKQFNNNLFLMCFHTTALALYLHKITGDTNIIIEAPLSGRFDPQWRSVVGNFIEMVRLNIRVDNNESVLSLYQHVREIVFDTLRESHSGCTRLLSSSRVHGVINMITHESRPKYDVLLQTDWHHTGHSDTHHPLRLHVADWNATGTPSLHMDLNRGFFANTMLDRTCAHLHNTYKAIIASRATLVNQVNILEPTEIWCLSGIPTSQPTNDFTSLPKTVETVCLSTPDALAVCDETQQLSYRELHQSILQVESTLKAEGIAAGSRVAVLMRRDINLPGILLGILRCGASYVPIDHSLPHARIQQIVKDAEVACVVVSQRPAEPGIHSDSRFCDTILTADDLVTLRHEAAKDPDAARNESNCGTDTKPFVDSQSPAYMIFTSGSTGTPKGVVISNGALMSYLSWANSYYALEEPIVMPLHTSISFDMTVTSLFLPLMNGGTIKVFTEHDDTLNSGAVTLLDVIRDSTVNTIKLTPSHLSLITDDAKPTATVKQLIVGGEDFRNSAARNAAGHFGAHVRIINEYGPTEATVGCIVHEWSDSITSQSVPIGTPIDGMSAYVLNSDQLPQFEGTIGELYLAGESLANGYWKRTEQTSDVFIDNPWLPGTRMYRTGDLVRVQNQQLQYLGRNDTQIKRNGFRIELGELEATITEHPDVTDCAVVMKTAISPKPLAKERQISQSLNETHCKLCGLSSRHPQGAVNDDGHCELCASYLPNEARIDEYFKDNAELVKLVNKIQNERQGQYDAVVLLSGGKDSTFTIAKLVDLGLKVYAFSLDNGFISDQAKNNIETVCRNLNIDHMYATTEHMNDIFVDSLTRYSNVCHGCFKTIYNLSMQFAEQHQIKYIFTGLSRGQLFETRLNNELFADTTLPVAKIDDMVQAARIQYHAVPDAPNRLLAIESVNSGALPEKIAIIDFYRYCHVELSDMIHYLQTRVGWVRPPDTGRSTNCLINDVGIHVHKQEQGFHNYSLPYSWDVRLGHKRRDEALEELDDVIDIDRVNTILNTIGYQLGNIEHSGDKLYAYVSGSDKLTLENLNEWIESQLPAHMLPTAIHIISKLPLNASGKIDRKQLTDRTDAPVAETISHALTTTESVVASVWRQHISTESIDLATDFFKSGGDSLSAIRCVVELRQLGYAVEPIDLFRSPKLNEFSRLLAKVPTAPVSAPAPSVATEKFSALNASQRDKLSKLLSRKKSGQHK